jgi:putative ABC transport system permease protein
MLQRLLDDVRGGTRILTKSPGLCATAGLLIALVIGGNTTVYSMLNGAIRSPAPGVTARDIVAFGLVGHPAAPYFDYTDYRLYASETRTLRSLAAWGFARTALETPAGTYLLQLSPVTTNYFDTLGITLGSGRPFTADDDRPGAPLVAIISDAIWQTHFARSAAAVGSRITIDGRPATVVGIGPPRFAGPLSGEWTDLWVPLHGFDPQVAETDVVMIGRLGAGSSVGQVRAEFATLRSRLEAAAPRARGGPTERNCPPQCERAPVLVTPYSASAGGFLPAFEREVLAIFSIVTFLTLAVVGANVANLMLARAMARQREAAVRQSLGASRARLVRLVVIEGLAISAVAGVLALIVAGWAAAFIPALLPVQQRGTMPIDFSPDWRVAAYAAVLTLVGTLLSSLLPALRTWKHNALPLLKDGSHTATAGRSRVSRGLVVLQLAFSVLLLTAAGLAYRSGTLMTTDVGFDTKNVLLVNVGTAAAVQSSAENVLLLDRIRERLATAPTVESASYRKGSWSAWNRREVRAESSARPVQVTQLTIGDEYFETLGLALISGRHLAARGDGALGGGAVVSAALAAELFPGRSPLGRTLQVEGGQRPVEIVGIAPDVYYTGFAQVTPQGPDPRPFYVFLRDRPSANPADRPSSFDTTTFYLRHRGQLDAAAGAVPGILRDIDRRVALASTSTLESVLEQRAISTTMISTLLLIFASMSLLIAGIGQYAVVTFDMRRRTRDFGVRIALGASGRDIVGSVLREGSGLTAIGLTVGFALSVGLATALRGLLFGVAPTDAPTYGGVFALLAGVSLLASYVPARRASRIDPVQALRQE